MQFAGDTFSPVAAIIAAALAPSWYALCNHACMAKKSFRKGDRVEWETSQGTTRGRVEKKLTSPRKIKDHEVAASAANPEYLVTSEKTGKQAAHKPEALKKAKSK